MINSVEEFLRCATSKAMEDYHRVTMDTATEDVWTQIIDQCPEHHYWIAGNRYLPERMMGLLAESRDTEVRRNIAMRYDIPEGLMVKLSKDKSAVVRKRIAENIACPEYLLEKLYKDGHPLPRQGVAQNRRAPKRLLRILVNDPVDYVRDDAIERLEIIKRRGIPKIPPYWDLVLPYENEPDPHPDE